jgi:hypothetical protein
MVVLLVRVYRTVVIRIIYNIAQTDHGVKIKMRGGAKEEGIGRGLRPGSTVSKWLWWRGLVHGHWNLNIILIVSGIYYYSNIDINRTPAEKACRSVPLPILLYFIPIITEMAFMATSIAPIIVHVILG